MFASLMDDVNVAVGGVFLAELAQLTSLSAVVGVGGAALVFASLADDVDVSSRGVTGAELGLSAALSAIAGALVAHCARPGCTLGCRLAAAAVGVVTGSFHMRNILCKLVFSVYVKV